MGNLLSVRRGLEHCGATVVITDDPHTIMASSRVVLPGVGAFADGMAGLRDRGLDAVLHEVARERIPLLGICLGMQMLLEHSNEFGSNAGLCLIPGNVIAVDATAVGGKNPKIPHIGWNALVPPQGRADWNDTLLRNTPVGESVYFVHSFMAYPTNPAHRIADCIYCGRRIAAVIGRDNIFGCQFHPEKSGPVGLGILNAFLRL